MLTPTVSLGVLTTAVGTCVLVAHWPALSANAHCFDDERYLTENPLVRNPGWESARRLLTEVFHPSTVQGYYHPLGTLSIMIDYAAGGRPEDRRVFNRTALALHVMNTCLVIVLLYLLLDHPWAAALAGLLFGVHPLTVETVVWLGQRKALLAASFALWSLVLYAVHVRRKSWGWLGASVAMYALALLSKPTGTPLPILMLLLDYWPLRRLNRRALAEKTPFLLVGVASGVLTVLSHASTSVVELTHTSGPIETVLLMCTKLVFYLWKIVWPINLSAHYMPPEPIGPTQPLVLAGIVGTGLLVVVGIMAFRRAPAMLVGMTIFVVAILPVLGVVRYSWVFAFDNYVYLPAVGLVLLAAWSFRWVWTTSRGTTTVLLRRGGLVLAVGALAFWEGLLTRRYLARWQDTETLFRHMVSLAPQAYRARNNLALALVHKSRLDEAIEEYHRALEIKPDFELAHNNLADALAQKGQLDQAALHYAESLRLKPDQPGVHFKLAGVLHRRGDIDGAIAHYTAALRDKPDFPGAHFNLANLFLVQNRFDEAVLHFGQAIRLRPDMAEAHNNLGAALFKQGRTAEAIPHYREALRLKPDFIGARRNLETALSRLKQAGEQTTGPP